MILLGKEVHLMEFLSEKIPLPDENRALQSLGWVNQLMVLVDAF